MRARTVGPAAADLPVAAVMIDSALPQLDHVFDYAVPAELDDRAVPGARVRVRFAGRLTDGFVVGRQELTDHAGGCGRSSACWAANRC